MRCCFLQNSTESTFNFFTLSVNYTSLTLLSKCVPKTCPGAQLFCDVTEGPNSSQPPVKQLLGFLAPPYTQQVRQSNSSNRKLNYGVSAEPCDETLPFCPAVDIISPSNIFVSEVKRNDITGQHEVLPSLCWLSFPFLPCDVLLAR